MRSGGHGPCLPCIQAALNGDTIAAVCRGPGVGGPCRRCRPIRKGRGRCVRAPQGSRGKVRRFAKRLLGHSNGVIDPAIVRRGRRILENARAGLRASGLVPSKKGPSSFEVMAGLSETLKDLAASLRIFAKRLAPLRNAWDVTSMNSSSAEERGEESTNPSPENQVTLADPRNDQEVQDDKEWYAFVQSSKLLTSDSEDSSEKENEKADLPVREAGVQGTDSASDQEPNGSMKSAEQKEKQFMNGAIDSSSTNSSEEDVKSFKCPIRKRKVKVVSSESCDSSEIKEAWSMSFRASTAEVLDLESGSSADEDGKVEMQFI